MQYFKHLYIKQSNLQNSTYINFMINNFYDLLLRNNLI